MIDETNQTMEDIQLDELSKREVREFFKKTLMILSDQEDYDHFLR
jgi:hypothetical protein